MNQPGTRLSMTVSRMCGASCEEYGFPSKKTSNPETVTFLWSCASSQATVTELTSHERACNVQYNQISI